MIERAITLGVKKEIREAWPREDLLQRTYDIFIRLGYKELVVGIEEYETTGLHVHVYYKGPPIYWKDFNKLWRIGYVKDRFVYDRDGWISYINKHEGTMYREDQYKKSIIERMIGISMEDYMKISEMHSTSGEGYEEPVTDDIEEYYAEDPYEQH